MSNTELLEDQETSIIDGLESEIILFNDNVNTFQWVIKCLMELCEHSLTQAEQCAMLVHNTGKCEVKRGAYKELEPVCSALLDRGLSAEIQ